MPNHVVNELKFEGLTPVEKSAILAATVNTEGRVDFTILLPLPINFWPGSSGREHEETFPGTWLDAASDTWGTKWNAYGINDRYQTISHPSEDALTLTFKTAWNPPYGWLMAIFNTFKGRFKHNFLDEGAERGKAAIYDYSKINDPWKIAEAWNEKDADDDMQRHLHKLLWGVEEFEDEGEDA